MPRRRPRPTSARSGVAAAPGITCTGVAPASVLSRARHELHRRAAAGFADSMSFTYRNPERSTDPSAAVAGAAAVFVGARPYVATEPARPPGVSGRVARYAWEDHVGALRDGLWDVARRLRADGWKAVAFADDNSIVDREVAYLAGIGWFGKSANLLVAGAGSWFVLGCVVTDAAAGVERAGGRRLRVVPALPRRLSDRSDRRAGRGRRQALPVVAAAEAGDDRAALARGHR